MKDAKFDVTPILKKFEMLFPTDLPPGLPPKRSIDHAIDLNGHAPPIKGVYRMSPAELQELKQQLKELLDKGFIRPSTSPYGAPIICTEEGRIFPPLHELPGVKQGNLTLWGPNRFWPGSGLVLRCLGPGFTVLALGPGFRPIFIHSNKVTVKTSTPFHEWTTC